MANDHTKNTSQRKASRARRGDEVFSVRLKTTSFGDGTRKAEHAGAAGEGDKTMGAPVPFSCIMTSVVPARLPAPEWHQTGRIDTGQETLACPSVS
jgi:hypothetical protein